MGTVNTTTSATATAYGNQRKIDRTSNGVLWAVHSSASNSSAAFAAVYSTDNGATWTNGGGLPQTSDGQTAEGYTPNMALHIDSSADGGDRAFVAYKDKRNGYIYFVTGVPNAARTAFTWSAATQCTSNTATDFPDLIAHREGSGWAVHIVFAITGNTTAKVGYKRLTVSSGGTVSSAQDLDVSAAIGAANSNAAYPSIDFNHTGDGKTVAGATPHLYVGWSAGATGSGYGIRFRKATYSAGSWTWGTEREIDNGHYVAGTAFWLTTHFDGTRVVFTGYLAGGPDSEVVLHDRDAADPNSGGTTLRTLLTGLSSGTPANALQSGSSSYDSAGNVYIFGQARDGAAGTRKLNVRRWVRATATLEAISTFDATGPDNPFISARRGPQGQAIDYVYTDGTASPYTVTSGRITLNQNPTAPTPQTPADNATWDSSTDQTVTFKPNDPDGDAASKVRIRYRPAGTTVAYAYLESTTAVPAGGTATVTVPANTWDGVIEYAEQSYDPSNAEGAWSPTRVVTGVPAALAAATGGQGGTSVDVMKLYDLVQSERALRALSLV